MTGLRFKARCIGPTLVKVDIQLAGQNRGVLRSYTTRDRIDGLVSIEVARKTPFDNVQISLEGQYARRST